MSNIDQIAAIKATLELVIQDNDEIADHFREVLSQLDAIEKLPPGIKGVQFRQLEQSGAFLFRGVDLRHFTKTTKRPLTPPQFLERTSRRLSNTKALNEAFMTLSEYDGGEELRDAIDEMIGEAVNAGDIHAIKEFRKQVVALRASDLFTRYMEIRKDYLKSNKDMRDEADFLATRESMEDGLMMAESQKEELEDIQGEMESGEITAEEAQAKMEAVTGGDGEEEATASAGGNEEAADDSSGEDDELVDFSDLAK